MNVGEVTAVSALGVVCIGLAAYLSDLASRKREDKFFARLRQSLKPRLDAAETTVRQLEKAAAEITSVRGELENTVAEISTVRRDMEDAARDFEEQGKALSELVPPSVIQKKYSPDITEWVASSIPVPAEEPARLNVDITCTIRITGITRLEDFVETLHSLENQAPFMTQGLAKQSDLRGHGNKVVPISRTRAA